jgi:hypothetical protein
VVWPWTKVSRTPAETGFASVVQILVVILFTVATGVVARYNWKAGRSDSRSAVRLGVYCAGTSLLTWVIGAHHVASSKELNLAIEGASDAAFLFVMFWLAYLALEPWVRRYWPHAMITWSRLLAGKWRDPLVGRDILFGALCGIVYCLLIQCFHVVSRHLGDIDFADVGISNLMGTRVAAASLAQLFSNALGAGLKTFLVLFLLRILLRKQWLAVLVFVALFVFADTANNQYGSTAVAVAGTALFILIYGILVLIMIRLGFFALVSAIFVVNSMVTLFLTPDFGAWYGQSSLIVVAVVGAFVVWGFHLSLAGRPLFAGTALTER